MAGYNRVVLLGNLTRDPQLSYTSSNTPICKFGLATNRSYKDRDGNTKEDVCFVDCTSFGRQGEVINQYMRKGRPILVEGRLQYSKWTTQEGDNRSKLEVVVESFTFVGGNRGGDGAPVGAASETEPGPPPHDDVPF